MNPNRTILCLLLALGTSEAGVDSYAWQAAEVRGDERAVLVLCPGMNQDGSFFLKESPWIEFAEANQLGLLSDFVPVEPGSDV